MRHATVAGRNAVIPSRARSHLDARHAKGDIARADWGRLPYPIFIARLSRTKETSADLWVERARTITRRADLLL